MNSKTFEAISKLKDIEIELHRLKNALEIANKIIDANEKKKEWRGLSDKARLHFVKNAPSWSTLQLIEAVEEELKMNSIYGN